MLRRILFYFTVGISCGRSFYDFKEADYHPYPMGARTISSEAQENCKKYLRRLCTNEDLEPLKRDQRHVCEHSWVYDLRYRVILGTIVPSKYNSCSDSDDKSPPGKYICARKNTEQEFDECTGNGVDYKGTKSVTLSGYKCKLWAKQKNFNSYSNPRNWNFCRNMGDKHLPWCYIDDNYKFWDYCDIKCQPFGKSDGCSITLFSEENFKGKLCTFSVEAAGWKSINQKGNPCRDFRYEFSSYKLNGNYCKIKITRKSFKPFFNFVDLLLLDYSADVILMPQSQSDEVYRKFFGYTSCSPSYIDESENLVDLQQTNKEGIAYSSAKRLIYKYGADRNSKFKQSLCCNDEKIEMSAKRYTLSNYKNACKNEREMKFKYNDKETTYHIPERVCTVIDIESHYYRGSELEYQKPVCLVERAKGEVVMSTGEIPPNSAMEKVCCCEADCLPLTIFCVKNEDCCTKKCLDNYCSDDESQKEPKTKENQIHSIISVQKKIIISIISLFILSWVLRCCFPYKRLISEQVRIHQE